jgi:hypothetical protein
MDGVRSSGARAIVDEANKMVRRGQRLIRMVSELHRLGYQRLRIMPYEAPLAWRLAIGPRDLFSTTNGAWAPYDGKFPAHYTAASGKNYFGWTDAGQDNARQLAEKFLQRFPEVCERALGRDWTYAGWLSELLGVLERHNAVPIATTELHLPDPMEARFLILRSYGVSCDSEFPLPPPGEKRVERRPPSPNFTAADLLAGFQATPDPLDLRAFPAVSALVGVAMAVGSKMFMARDDSAEHHLLPPIAAAFAGNDPSYTIDKAWCRPERLGRALIQRFGLPVHILLDDSFESLVLFGLEHVSLAVRAILANTEAKADWKSVTWPLLTEVHTLAASVFVGSSATLFPTLTLDDLVLRSLRN